MAKRKRGYMRCRISEEGGRGRNRKTGKRRRGREGAESKRGAGGGGC